MLAPSRRCASGIVSRSRQNISRCVSLAAIAASAISPASIAAASSASMLSRAAAAPRPMPISSSTYHGCGRSSGSLVEATCCRTSSSATRGTSSNVVTASLVNARSRDSSATAACGSGTPTKAVSCPRGTGEEFAGGCGDDAERAFRADEQIAQVVARVVLAQRLETFEHAAVGQHDFESEHEVAHHAVAQDRGAAGVGRQVAAELARAFRAEAHREQPIDRRRCRLDLGEHATGFGDHRVVRRIERADAPHARERQHDLRAVGARRRASAVAGVAADRHDADPRFVAQLHDGGDLLGRIRAQHERRRAAIQLAMIDEERLDIRRPIEIAVRSDYRAQAIQCRSIDAHRALTAAATSSQAARRALRGARLPRSGRRRSL